MKPVTAWMPQSDIGSPGGIDRAAQAAVEHANTNASLAELATLPGYVYVGSPYSKYADGLPAAARVASWATAKLMNRGLLAFSPIAHSHAVAEHGDVDPLDWSLWQRQDQPLMDAASSLVVLMLDGWQDSVGLNHEIECFIAAHKPIVYVNLGDL